MPSQRLVSLYTQADRDQAAECTTGLGRGAGAQGLRDDWQADGAELLETLGRQDVEFLVREGGREPLGDLALFGRRGGLALLARSDGRQHRKEEDANLHKLGPR